MANDLKERVDYYLELFRRGERDNSFFGLLETSSNVVPLLVDVYNLESDAAVREFVVKVVWQRRDPSTIPFLAKALDDPAPGVWKAAIDGLVTLGSDEAVTALRKAQLRLDDNKRVELGEWIDEAIQQSRSRSFSQRRGEEEH